MALTSYVPRDASKLPIAQQTGPSDEGQVVVVTGAAGCLGHHIVKLLIKHDDRATEIRCMDIAKPCELQQNYIDKELLNLALEGRQRKTIKWIDNGDICDINIVEQTLSGAECVIHCAAQIETAIYYANQNRQQLEAVNVQGTENLLKTCIEFGIPKFIHISSFESWQGYEMVYFASEQTVPIPRGLLFGASGETKLEAKNKVVQYANTKLRNVKKNNNQLDSLQAVILSYPLIYGEFDKHFIAHTMKIAKYFNGTLRRVSNTWSRQQPIYAGNAAWAVIKAKQKLDQNDETINGEEFIITDDTPIVDLFVFIRPYLETKGMSVTRSKWPYIPLWLLMIGYFILLDFLRCIDVFGLFTERKSRLDEELNRKQSKLEMETEKAKEKSSSTLTTAQQQQGRKQNKQRAWYHYVNPQLLTMSCITSFFNRSKSTLRLDYEPLFCAEESERRSLAWYENHCQIE